MYAFSVFAALATAAQQAPAPTPPLADTAPHPQQVDTIAPSAQPATEAAPQPAAPAATSARKPARHKGLHVSKAAAARASRAAGGAIAGPAGAAVAPVLVDRAGHKVKKLVHHHKHHLKPVTGA